MDILLTLGHNSSAIALDNKGNVLAGYEEERLSRIKSDKSFPKLSIMKILSYAKKFNWLDSENYIYISHWYNDFNFFKENQKPFCENNRYDYEFIEYIKKNYNFKDIVSLTNDFTHHDAHSYAALNFFKNNSKFYDISEKIKQQYIIVADGFGNNEETISIYRYENNILNLVERIYGFESSLGLVYQFATSFCKMKENQDEYKFLGYESHIDEIPEDLKNKVEELVDKLIHNFKCNIKHTKIVSKVKYVDVDRIQEVKNKIYELFDSYTKGYDVTSIRIFIGNAIQNFIERIMVEFIEKYKIQHIVLAGGLFYNVKLNNKIMKNVKTISIFPLAGDQGAALGFRNAIYDNLYFGHRDFSSFIKKEQLIEETTNKLKKNEIVQIVVDSMEFGPRALCHTTTLSCPFKDNVDIINSLNKRNTVMPMAPVMLESSYKKLFPIEQTEKIIGSERYMIITCDYHNNIEKEKYLGVMHKYPIFNIYSGRPQVIYDTNHFMHGILTEMKNFGLDCLINTSYNVHGVPIVYTEKDAKDDFEFQKKEAEDNNITKKINLITGNVI